MKGNLRISRDTRTNNIRIYVEDRLSEVTFLTVDVAPEDFAKALTGNYDNDCEFELQGLEVIGKRQEIKHEIIVMPSDSRYTDEEKAAAVKPFEVDGWMARTHTIGNHHYEVEGQRGAYRISLIRFVESTDDN